MDILHFSVSQESEAAIQVHLIIQIVICRACYACKQVLTAALYSS